LFEEGKAGWSIRISYEIETDVDVWIDWAVPVYTTTPQPGYGMVWPGTGTHSEQTPKINHYKESKRISAEFLEWMNGIN